MLSKHQKRILKEYAHAAVGHFLKTYKLDCCTAAVRVAFEVLSKFHFKVRPLTVDVKVYSKEHVQKGRNPSSQEEFKEWLKEGAAAHLITDHLVAIIDEQSMVDLSINQSMYVKEVLVPPVICDVNEDFLKGEKPIFIENASCVMVYDAFPAKNIHAYQRDWFDKRHTADIVSEVYAETRKELRAKSTV